MAIRHHSVCELYKTNLCQFCCLRIAVKKCSHSNYLFQRCSLKNEVRRKCIKQLCTKASFTQHLPSNYRALKQKKHSPTPKKKSLQNSTQKSVVFNAVAYSDFTNIGNYLRYSHLNQIWPKGWQKVREEEQGGLAAAFQRGAQLPIITHFQQFGSWLVSLILIPTQ